MGHAEDLALLALKGIELKPGVDRLGTAEHLLLPGSDQLDFRHCELADLSVLPRVVEAAHPLQHALQFGAHRSPSPTAAFRRSSGAARYRSSFSSELSASRTARTWSTPIASDRLIDPIGGRKPSSMPEPTSAGVPLPSPTRSAASLTSWESTRPARSPGAS